MPLAALSTFEGLKFPSSKELSFGSGLGSIPHLYFFRDDKLPLGFGTKWRKLQGILEILKTVNTSKVLLWGSIHGNYLASFTFILRCHGIKVDTIAYTRDPNLRTYNERLVRSHSQSIDCYANRKIAYQVWLERQNNYPGLVLPEFGIHPGQILGLQSFWKKSEDAIQSLNYKKAILVLEIGSGASFLSAFDYFDGSSILVLGVMVGEPKQKWLEKVKDLQIQLGLKNIPIPKEQILELPTENAFPIPNKKPAKFGKKNQERKDWIGRFFRNTDILLEPVYSGITVNSMLREIYELPLGYLDRKNGQGINLPVEGKEDLGKKFPTGENPEFNLNDNQFLKPSPSGEMIPIFYLHQGGQIQHLDLVFNRN